MPNARVTSKSIEPPLKRWFIFILIQYKNPATIDEVFIFGSELGMMFEWRFWRVLYKFSQIPTRFLPFGRLATFIPIS